MTRWTTHEDVDNMLGYHPTTDVTGPVHEAVRQACAALGHRLVELLPEGPTKTVVISQKLREVTMWANSAVATQDDPLWRREVAQLTITDEHDNVRYPRLVLEQPLALKAGLSPDAAATLIFEALGAASVCWMVVDDLGNITARHGAALGALAFDSSEAAQVGRELMAALGYALPAGYREDADIPAALVDSHNGYMALDEGGE